MEVVRVIEEDDPSGDAFRRKVNKRLRQAKECAESALSHRMLLLQSSWATEAMDKLEATLDHNDASHGHVLMTIADPHGPVYQALVELLKRVEDTSDKFGLGLLFDHFRMEPDADLVSYRRDLRQSCMAEGGHLWARLGIWSEIWPMPLLRLQDNAASEEDKADIEYLFQRANRCDLDPLFGLVVRDNLGPGERSWPWPRYACSCGHFFRGLLTTLFQ